MLFLNAKKRSRKLPCGSESNSNLIELGEKIVLIKYFGEIKSVVISSRLPESIAERSKRVLELVFDGTLSYRAR